MVRSPRLVRRVAGGYRLTLGDEDRDVLRSIVERLEAALEEGGPDAVRLYPPAFPDDPDAEASYRAAVHDDLVTLRERRIGTFKKTLETERLDPGQAEAWLGVLTDVRLVLGTALDVTQDDDEDPTAWSPEDPDALDRLCYLYAGVFVAQLVDAIASSMPDET
jgi:hypothetical protein